MNSENIRKGSVLLVAAIAALVSFLHIRHLALTHGGDRWSSALLPVAIDGAVVAATMSMIRASGFWKGWARCLLALSVGLTLAANVAYGWTQGPWGGILWAWPAVAFFGCAELAIGMARHAAEDAGGDPAADAVPDAARGKPARKPAPVPVPGAVPVPEPVWDAIVGIEEARPVPDELARHAWLRSAASGEPLSERKMAERFGRSRMYWKPRIEKWREATA